MSFVEGEPLIEDEELDRRLGYERPRDVRRLASRLFKDSELRGVVSQTGGRPAKAFLLNERQALKVCFHSKTDLAEAIQDEVIEVFLAVRSGRLARVAIDPTLARLLERTAEISAQLAGKAEEQGRQLADVAAKVDDKADRAELEALRVEVEGLRASGASSPKETAKGSPKGWCAELLREAGLPLDRVRGDRGRFLFWPVVQSALEVAGVKHGAPVGAARASVQGSLLLAKGEVLRCGWDVDPSGTIFAFGGRRTLSLRTVVKRCAEVARLRKPASGQTSIAGVQ